MKIIIKFPNRRTTSVEGKVLDNTPVSELKRFYEAERAINELTNLRVHISIEDDSTGDK